VIDLRILSALSVKSHFPLFRNALYASLAQELMAKYFMISGVALCVDPFEQGVPS
jgi:hypothetical protein